MKHARLALTGLICAGILCLGGAAAGQALEGKKGSPAMQGQPDLKYDWDRHPRLRWGYNDLNRDGVADTLVTVWNGKTVAFVSDDGKLPWSAADEGRDWGDYFNRAFNVGQAPPAMWNGVRGNWGNYTILVDRDGCGRFDSPGDFYYKTLDINGDGAPEAEYYHLFPGSMPWSNKLHVNLNGERDMSYLDWRNFYYADEQRYLPGGKYIMNVHGNGFFLNSYSPAVQTAWENPIAWYDFDFDGRTNMVMRAADTHTVTAANGDPRYRGDLGEFEIAFELNGNTGPDKFHSLDMQLTFLQYRGRGPGYRTYLDRVPLIRGLPEAAFLSERLLATRQEPLRRYFPYLDGFKRATDFDGWEGVWLLFDEDDDDNRWEEMFGKHEQDWAPFSDRVGDRIEVDADYGGRGKLYVGRFDGRIHLYHAETAFWDIDYLALYKGSTDRKQTGEGPEPPVGLRYPRVRYSDRNRNGFIDTIEYMTVEYGREAETEKIERTISLLGLAGEGDEAPDVCPLIDPRVEAPLTGWRLEKWNGQPLGPQDFAGSPNKEVYDRMIALYANVAEQMWRGAWKLYQTAKRHRLNVSEDLDRELKLAWTKEELGELRALTVPAGYSRHLAGRTRREQYHNGFWLREKVFQDLLDHSGLDPLTLQRDYYAGRIDALCERLDRGRR